MIEICSVGGYNEVGKNCTAIKVDDEVVICDLGLHLENYTKYTGDEDVVKINPKELIRVGAVPDVTKIKDWQKKVVAIVPTHAHLDHIGAIPYLGNYFDAPIICTPFSAAVLRAILGDEKISLRNKIIELKAGSSFRVSKNIVIEFVNSTHSTPQTVMAVIHTKYGKIIYANDFKLDLFPTLGEKPDFKRLKQLGRKGVLALIVDSTYAPSPIKMPSESVAREMLKDVLLGTDAKGKAIIVTTFSSHIARIKSIVELGRRLNRKVMFLGRSLSKYTSAAESVGIVKFSKQVEIIKYSSKIKRALNKVNREGREKYLLVVTGHQGEPKSTLRKIARGEFNFKIGKEDHIIFSCKTIPSPTNIRNRKELEEQLHELGVRMFMDIHVSGHAGREDIRDLIKMTNPKHIIPAHGELKMTSALQDLALEMGYKNMNVHLMQDLDRIKID